MPTRRRPPPPEGFVLPCQPTLVAKPPEAAHWRHEIKFDGYRILARAEAGRARLWSRSAREWIWRLPRIAGALAGLPVASVTLDGEAVSEDALGRSDFHALRSAEGQRNAVLVVWDLLELNGYDARGLPLAGRRGMLESVCAEGPADIIVADMFDDGRALFGAVCRMRMEGIVSKRVDAPYWLGRSLTWLKTKCAEYVRQGGST